MNYYEHHIRDYDAATSHLSWDEDLAYTRLLRWYYRKEQPIPADVKEACRQVRAITKAQRDAVVAVLNEFFELKEDGWHKDDCDEAIAEYQAGAPEREIKKANEKNRTERHREERARLFKTLTDGGGHAPWNIGIADLRIMVSRLTVTAPATANEQPVTKPVTAPATPVTATQSPITNHQTPDTSIKNLESSLVASTVVGPEKLLDERSILPERSTKIAVLLRAKGVKPLTFAHPLAHEWAADPRVTDAILEAAVQQARDYKPQGDISPNYLKPIVEQLVDPPEARPSKPREDWTWKKSNAGIDAKGRELGMFPRGSESYPDFASRIESEIDRRKGAQP